MIRKVVLLILCVSSLLATVRYAPAQTAKEPCSPAIRFWKLLNGVQISNRGILRLGEFYAVCLPEPARQSSSNYPFDPDDGGKLSTLVKKSDGQTLATYVWYAENVSTLWVMNRFKVIGGPSAIKPLEPGNYVLEFAIEDKPFYRFPFSVSMAKSDDAYNPGDLYFLDGLWSEYGGLYYPNVNRYLQFNVWLRARGKPKREGTQYELKLIRESDGKVIAEDAGPNAAVSLKPEWNQYKLSFRPIKNEASTDASYEFKASELLKSDGKYVVRLSLDGALYGEYPFTVKSGKIEYQGNQSRESATPLMYIEDGNNSYWIKRRAAR